MKYVWLLVFFVSCASRSEQAPRSAQKNVEVYFVADHKALSQYFQETSSVAEAKKRMEGDIDYFITQLNVHYESLGNLNVVISKRGLKILDKDLFPAPNNQVLPETGLNTFKKWLKSQGTYRKLNYDTALLFTGYDLARSSKNNGTAGLAGVGVVCYQGAAIVEYDGTYNTVSVAAHEIAHNLGADHDSKGSGYIMAPSTNAPSKTRWNFSDLSYSYISRNLNRVSMSRYNCLAQSSPDSVIPHTRVPDQLANPDGVCTRKFGPQSYFCRMSTSAPKGDEMCTSFFCSVGYTNGTCIGATSSDGLVCGAGKACVKGNCVVDKQSKTKDLDENCLYGDQKKIPHDGDLLSCGEWLNTGVSGCNNDYTRTECCASCEKKATGDPNCPYGDQDALKFSNRKDLTTCAEYLKGTSCTMPSVQSMCCGTCGKRATGDPNCPYGDEMLNFSGTGPQTCSSYLAERGNGVCKQDYIKRKCCSSCKKAATGNPACPFGDVAHVNVKGIGKKTCGEFISQYGKSQCSMAWMKRDCCASCGVTGGTSSGSSSGSTGNTGNTGGNTGSTGSEGDSTCSDKLRITSNGKSYECSEYLKVKGGAKCNDAGIKKGCCASCAKKETGNPKCRYGDMNGIQYGNARPQTCGQILNKNGDSECYRDDFRNKFCCGTCGKRESGDTNCLFGDRSSDCKRYSPDQICRSQTNAKMCCGLCKNYPTRGRRAMTEDARGRPVESIFLPNPIVNIPEPVDMGIDLGQD